MRLTLLTRRLCGLCDETAALLRELSVDFESVDIDAEPALLERYNEAIPVILADGSELCRAPITRDGLRAALSALNLEVRA